LAITAFLAQENNIWDGTRLTKENMEQMRVRPAEATPTPEVTFTIVPLSTVWPGMLLGSGLALVFLVGVVWLWQRRRQ
jgi:hypothetical protein